MYPVAWSVVDTNEYETTPIAKVARNWAWFMRSTIEFNKIVRQSLTLLLPALQLQQLFSSTDTIDERIRNLQRHNHAMRAEREIEGEFSTMNSFILVAAWAGFESFIEDFCRSTLVVDPSLLWSESLRNVKVKQSLSPLNDEEAEAILGEAFNKTDRKLRIGINKIKIRLKHVSLDCDASEELESRVSYAQQLRHVIAHNASVADEKFVDRCTRHSYTIGERVTISSSTLTELLAGLLVYGLLIVNTDRTGKGLPPFQWPLITPDPALEVPYKENWGHISAETGWFAEQLPLFEQVEL